MVSAQYIVRDAVSGLIAGAIVLGAGGRLLMRVIALLFGGATGFSWGGTFEVVLFGALVGLAAGLAHAILVRKLIARPLWQGAILGLGAYLALALARIDASRAIAAYPENVWFLVLLAFAALFLAFGLVLARWRQRA